MKAIIEFILKPIAWWKQRQAFKKRLEELRKRDPFIYK
jgi:hypothetical protein